MTLLYENDNNIICTLFVSCYIFHVFAKMKKMHITTRVHRDIIRGFAYVFRTHLAKIRETTDLRHLTGFIRRAAVCPNEPTGQ